MNPDEGKLFFEQISLDLQELLKLQTEAKSIDVPDLIMRLDKFTSRKPASITRLVYECAVLNDTHVL